MDAAGILTTLVSPEGRPTLLLRGFETLPARVA